MKYFSVSFHATSVTKSTIVPATNFSRQKYFFGACSELYGRKFGHLATVRDIDDYTVKDAFIRSCSLPQQVFCPV
jgi:hypothetical protein